MNEAMKDAITLAKYTAQKTTVPNKTRRKSRFARATSINHFTIKGSRRESPLPRTMQTRFTVSSDRKGLAWRPSHLNSEDIDFPVALHVLYLEQFARHQTNIFS